MKLKLLFACLAWVMLIKAQTPTWKWEHNGQNKGQDFGNSVSADKNGNCYGIGNFDTQNNVNPYIVFGTNTSSADASDYVGTYITKYDSLGRNVWAKSIHGGDLQPSCIKTDSIGNSYMILNGVFSTSVTLGTQTISTLNESVVVAKYDSSGTALWACSAGDCEYSPYGRLELGFDAYGNSYATGNCSPGTAGSDSLILTKISPSGYKLWTKYVHGIGWYAFSMNNDKRGNSYVTGCLKPGYAINFHGAVLTNSSTTGTSIFVAKYDSSGTITWAKDLSASNFISLNDPHICIDMSGNSYITGHFTGHSVSFGNVTFTNYSNSFSSEDIFLVKLDAQGNFVWARQAGGVAIDETTGIACDEQGSVLITGFFENAASFGTVAVSGVNDVAFLAKYDADGNALWAKSMGGNNSEIFTTVAAGINDQVFITGNFFAKRFVFGTDTLVNSDTIHGSSDTYFAMLKGDHLATGIAQNKLPATSVVIFPNPFKDEAVIRSAEPLMDAELAIYNAVGLEVRKISRITGTRYTISRGDLPPGIYFFTLSDKGRAVKTAKLILE